MEILEELEVENAHPEEKVERDLKEKSQNSQILMM